MTLLAYLNGLPLSVRGAFATRCGTTFDYLRQIAYGNRRCTESIAINIDRETSGEICCEILCPNVDWAYLRGTEAESCKVLS